MQKSAIEMKNEKWKTQNLWEFKNILLKIIWPCQNPEQGKMGHGTLGVPTGLWPNSKESSKRSTLGCWMNVEKHSLLKWCLHGGMINIPCNTMLSDSRVHWLLVQSEWCKHIQIQNIFLDHQQTLPTLSPPKPPSEHLQSLAVTPQSSVDV